MNDIKLDLKELDRLIEGLHTKTYVDVGIVGKKSTDDKGFSVASYGAVHEFGSPARKIPRRSFIAMPLNYKKKIVQKTADKFLKDAIKESNFKKLFALIGVTCVGIIDDAFETEGFGTWEKDKPATIARKGSEAVLIDTGTLRKSISFRLGGD